MDEAGLSLLSLLRDLPLHSVEFKDAATVFVFGPGDLVRRLGATYLAAKVAGTAAPLLQPWHGAPALPLTQALAHVPLTAIGFVAGSDEQGLLLLAASPKRGPAEDGFVGGSVALAGSLTGMETDTGIPVDSLTLRRAAAERAGSQMATGSAADLKRKLADIFAGSLHPLLRSAGFRVGAAFSYRVGREVTHFVETTYSRFNTAVELGFDFNLGASYGDFSNGKISRQRLISDGFPSILRPIGALWNCTGLSYALRPDSDAEVLAQRLLNDFASQALPWLDALDSVDALVGFLDREDAARGGHGNALFAAILLARAGQAAEARRYLGMAEGPPEAVARTAATFGITLDQHR